MSPESEGILFLLYGSSEPVCLKTEVYLATSAKRQKKMDPATLQSQASSASLDSTTSSQDLRPPHKPQSIDNIVLQYDEPAQEPPQPVIPDTISANTREIIANCNAVDPVEVLLIDDFLNGRYGNRK